MKRIETRLGAARRRARSFTRAGAGAVVLAIASALVLIIACSRSNIEDAVPILFLLLFSLAAAFWCFRSAKRLRAADYGCCAGCEYDLRGNTSGVCPECGRKVPVKNSKTGETASDLLAMPIEVGLLRRCLHCSRLFAMRPHETDPARKNNDARRYKCRFCGEVATYTSERDSQCLY